MAESISVSKPRNWRKGMLAVTESGGTWVTVSDEDIMKACQTLASSTGVFAEPAGAAAFAGILRAREEGWISGRDSVLHVVTGNGLKDSRGATRAAPEAYRIGPTMEDLRGALFE